MKHAYVKEFERLRQEQAEGLSPICPRCGGDTMRLDDKAMNATSRYETVAICHNCGDDEALRKFANKRPYAPYQWSFIHTELKGHTFLDLLQSGIELDCDLVIADVDMPATFVWYNHNRLTLHGQETYGELLMAPYESLENGNYSIFCENEQLGKDFCLTAAGYSSNQRYYSLFVYEEIRSDDITVMEVFYSTEHEAVDSILSIDVIDSGRVGLFSDVCSGAVTLHIRCNPHNNTIEGCFHLKDHQGEDKSLSPLFYPTIAERTSILQALDQYIMSNCGRTLERYIRTQGLQLQDDSAFVQLEDAVSVSDGKIFMAIGSWPALSSWADKQEVAQDGATSRYLAVYHPDDRSVECVFVVIDEEAVNEIIPLKQEDKEQLQAAMFDYCHKLHGCSLQDFWEQHKGTK